MLESTQIVGGLAMRIAAISCLLMCAGLVLSTPLQAQEAGCSAQPRKRGGFAGFMGELASKAAQVGLGKVGIDMSTSMKNNLNAALIDMFACKLQPKEREQAAAATKAVVERPVGSSITVQSQTRPQVSTSHTVVSSSNLADGTICKDVRDVATINGEETTVVKKMCRAPGASGYEVQVA